MGTMTGMSSDHFALDFDTAARMASVCKALLDELAAALRSVEVVKDAKGMGTLQSGINLAAKFSRKAVGGEDSLEKSLTSHIQVVTEMRDFFQQCVDRYGEVDDSNASALASVETPR